MRNGTKNDDDEETRKKKKMDHEHRFHESDSEEDDWNLEVDTISVPRVEGLIRLSNKTVTIGLLDTGSSNSLLARDLITGTSVIKTDKKVKWKTQVGSFETNQTATIPFALPQFDPKRKCCSTFHIFDGGKYDVVIGRDILLELGMKINFKERCITWDEISVEMLDLSSKSKQAIKELYSLQVAKYKAADLAEVVNQITSINQEEKGKLQEVLNETRELFEGKKEHWTGEPVHIEHRTAKHTKPISHRPYAIPISQIVSLLHSRLLFEK